MLLSLCERGLVPDRAMRWGMRQLIAGRLRDEGARGQGGAALAPALSEGPIAVHAEAANRQHYEWPAAFYRAHLGPRLKYSCCLYPAGNETLAQAEEAMLALYAERAQLADGQRILDLGCGWGSAALWMAQRYPRARVTALSNAASQREYIRAQADAHGLRNLEARTGDVSAHEFPAGSFDRIVSIEMFEHMRNYDALLRKLARWLAPGGRLFVHVFCHRACGYVYRDEGAGDWMARHFFTGGLMPPADLLAQFPHVFALETQWWIPGTHYRRTAEDWLARLDANRGAALEALRPRRDARGALLEFRRRRMFYLAVAELFGFRGGAEWGVGHYRLAPARA